jgi:hypothetical protein
MKVMENKQVSRRILKILRNCYIWKMKIYVHEKYSLFDRNQNLLIFHYFHQMILICLLFKVYKCNTYSILRTNGILWGFFIEFCLLEKFWILSCILYNIPLSSKQFPLLFYTQKNKNKNKTNTVLWLNNSINYMMRVLL